MTAQEVISAAYQKLLVIPLGGTPSTGQNAFGLARLQTFLASWRQYGLTTWARKTQTFPLTAGKQDYSLGTGGDVVMPRPVRILGAYITADSDVPIAEISKAEYFQLSDKATPGQPSQFWFEPTLAMANLTLWPVTDQSDATCTIDYHAPLDTMALSDTLDIPDEWLSAVENNFSLYLAPGTGRTAGADLKELAADSLAYAVSSSTEGGSVFFEPDFG